MVGNSGFHCGRNAPRPDGCRRRSRIWLAGKIDRESVAPELLKTFRGGKFSLRLKMRFDIVGMVSMSVLKLKIFPCPDSRDHEVRIIVDDADWLGEDSLGIDPPNFFGQPALWINGNLLVGRCVCGCEGCGDTFVDTAFGENTVVWTNESGLRLTFDRAEYQREITRASLDFSWEDENRRVERLVADVFAKSEIDGFVFDWASARIKKGVITLSFSRDGSQKLVEFGWKPGSIEEAVQCARRVHLEKIGSGGAQ
jgi:hypothetical protein